MQETTCTGKGRIFLHNPSGSKPRQELYKRNYRKEISSINFQTIGPFRINYEINLAQNSEINTRIIQSMQVKINVYIKLSNRESTRVNELGWLAPSQLAHFPFRKQNESTLKYA